jgi:DNA-binding FadR family transcriptional regulator
VAEGQTIGEYVDADMVLHRAIVAAAHNDVLLELFDGFIPRVRAAMIDMLDLYPIGSGAPDDDQAAHTDLVQAIADGASATAAQLSRTHLDSLRRALS